DRRRDAALAGRRGTAARRTGTGRRLAGFRGSAVGFSRRAAHRGPRRGRSFHRDRLPARPRPDVGDGPAAARRARAAERAVRRAHRRRGPSAAHARARADRRRAARDRRPRGTPPPRGVRARRERVDRAGPVPGGGIPDHPACGRALASRTLAGNRRLEAWDLRTTGDELELGDVAARLGPARAAQLAPTYPDTAPTIVPPGEWRSGRGVGAE